MEKFYSVIRIFYKGETETHSVEIKSTLADAQKRFFSILAADFGNDEVTWCACYVIDSNGLMVEGRVFDKTTVVAESEE